MWHPAIRTAIVLVVVDVIRIHRRSLAVYMLLVLEFRHQVPIRNRVAATHRLRGHQDVAQKCELIR